jgi:hypothetical protein
MPGTKISQMPVATNATGALVPILQDAVNKAAPASLFSVAESVIGKTVQPTGANGSVYYNQVANTFNGYAGGAWREIFMGTAENGITYAANKIKLGGPLIDNTNITYTHGKKLEQFLNSTSWFTLYGDNDTPQLIGKFTNAAGKYTQLHMYPDSAGISSSQGATNTGISVTPSRFYLSQNGDAVMDMQPVSSNLRTYDAGGKTSTVALWAGVYTLIGNASGANSMSLSVMPDRTVLQSSYTGGEVAKFHSNGEFETLLAGTGIYLTAPNFTRYRITVTNAGALSVAAA